MTNILLPVETINREIDFRIVLAGLLAGGEHKFYIGQHDFLMSLLPKMKGGYYIGKNIFHKRADQEDGAIYKQLKAKDFNIVYLHEEGAVFGGKEADWQRVLTTQYNTAFFDKTDIVCDWGEFQKEFDQSRTAGNVDFAVTGHPRFDLYKKEWIAYFEDEVKEIKSIYKEYVLLNGNYGTFNHGLGISHVFSDKWAYVVEDIPNRIKRVSNYVYSGAQCLYMIELTHKLAVEFPHKNFIYRPHPSENHDYYKTIFNKVPNIHVVHKGPVAPWIIGADALIHDGCTTAIEATICGKPVINYKPDYNADLDIWLPNQMGVKATSFNEVKDILSHIENFRFSFDELPSKKLINDVLYNFGHDSFAALLNVVKGEMSKHPHSNTASPADTDITKQYLKLKARNRLAMSLGAARKERYSYHAKKFPGFDKTYIERKFDFLSQKLGKDIRVKFHNQYLIEVK